MAKYVFIYSGGQMPQTDAEREAVMAKWGQWFGKLGQSVVDAGNPFGSSKTVAGGGAKDGGKSNLGGYSIVNADSLDTAATWAKGCPILERSGTVEVYETFDIM